MSSNDKPQATMPTSSTPDVATNDLPIVAFESIASGQREVVIEYRGQQYRLRATRNGKLILNK
jgi:hemin uptake protein HemP